MFALKVFSPLLPKDCCFVLFEVVSCVSQADLIHCVAKDEPELLISLPPPHECWSSFM